MSSFIFDDLALATLDGAKNTSDGRAVSMQQKQEVISYLRSRQSGPDGVTSFAGCLTTMMLAAGRRHWLWLRATYEMQAVPIDLPRGLRRRQECGDGMAHLPFMPTTPYGVLLSRHEDRESGFPGG